MENFEKMLKFVLKYEGGYVNDKHDFGGETNKGVTHSTYKAYLKSKGLPEKSVKLITDQEVRDIYYNNYYKPSGAHNMKSKKLAAIVFDTAVNMGVSRSKTFLTQSSWDIKKYLELRCAKYHEFAKVNQTQKRFLKGWLNRINAIESFIKTIEP